jgi:membrane fusion protein, multidrug efflux system
VLFQVGPPTGKEKPEAENTDGVVSIRAPCDGLVGGFSTLRARVRKGTSLTAVSDDSAMRVCFDMPDRRCLAFMTEWGEDWRRTDLELILADHSKYPHAGKIVETLASFGTPNGGITFLAEFRNPDGLLRPGQTGTSLMNRVLKDAILIPQGATFEDHAKRYVYVVDKDHVAHRREIFIQDDAEGLFVIRTGVGVGDKIVLDGVTQVRDGHKVE